MEIDVILNLILPPEIKGLAVDSPDFSADVQSDAVHNNIPDSCGCHNEKTPLTAERVSHRQAPASHDTRSRGLSANRNRQIQVF